MRFLSENSLPSIETMRKKNNYLNIFLLFVFFYEETYFGPGVKSEPQRSSFSLTLKRKKKKLCFF